MDPRATVLLSVATSSVVAALVTGLFGGRNERKKQLLESRRLLAGEFAAQAMAAAAALRHFKPTTREGHRNERLHTDASLRESRAEVVGDAIDRLRPLRGRVWVTFPGRSPWPQVGERHPRTTSDWAEEVIASLRAAEKACISFWDQCDREPESRIVLEQELEPAYAAARSHVWDRLDGFADSAAERLEHGVLFIRVSRRLTNSVRALRNATHRKARADGDREGTQTPAG